MDLALFTNGQKSIAGLSNGQSSVFDSGLIFQDPDLFRARFLFQVQNRFGIKGLSEIKNLIIALSGLIDTKNNIIKSTYLLNDLSKIKIYNGFNINAALDSILPKENIFVLNDASSIALGVRTKVNNFALPCMVLILEDGVGISFINKSTSIMSVEWGGDFVPSMGKKIYDALGRDSIYSLLLSQKIDINKYYTEYLIKTIYYLIQKYEQDNQQVQSVFVLGEKMGYIDAVQLKANSNNYQLTFINDESQKNEIILAGCFAYPDYFMHKKNKVIKIQYFSGQELIYDFDNFQKCKQHFISVKPISNPDNYYKISFSDGSTKTVELRNLNDSSELEFYSF